MNGKEGLIRTILTYYASCEAALDGKTLGEERARWRGRLFDRFKEEDPDKAIIELALSMARESSKEK